MGKVKKSKTVAQVSGVAAASTGRRSRNLPVTATESGRAASTKGRRARQVAAPNTVPTTAAEFVVQQQVLMQRMTAIDARLDTFQIPAAAGSAETLPRVVESRVVPSAPAVVDQSGVQSEAGQASEAVDKEPVNPIILTGHDELPGTLVAPFISVTHDIDGHVPFTIKKKIQASQYIDLAYLLEGSIQTSDPGSYSLNLTMGESPSGALTLKAPGPKRQISNIEQWTDAFLVFASVYLKIHPKRELELLAYMRIVRRAATYGSIGFKSYDEQFRHVQQSIPSRSWSSIDSELYMVYVLGPKSGQPLPFRADAGQAGNISTSQQSKPICYKFNGPSGCPYPQGKCQYEHACRKCDSKAHSLQKCPTK